MHVFPRRPAIVLFVCICAQSASAQPIVKAESAFVAARYAEAEALLERGALLRPDSYRAMYAPARLHGGAIAGFSSIVNRSPGERLTVIVLSNGKQGADRLGQADAIARAIADAMGVGRAR